MPDPEYVWVKNKATSHQYPLSRDAVDAEPDLYEVLDKPAVDASGRPLPAKPNKRLSRSVPAKKAASKSTASSGGSSQTSSTTPDAPAETKE